MRTLIFILVALCAPLASAQVWNGSFVPVEETHSYNAYRGPYNGGYPMVVYPRYYRGYGRYYYDAPVVVPPPTIHVQGRPWLEYSSQRSIYGDR